jgi:hypothetical protein
MLEYFLQRYLKDCTKKRPLFQRAKLLHIELELQGLNYQTPFYADCILKYREIAAKSTFWLINLAILKQSQKSNISKQIYKGEK